MENNKSRYLSGEDIAAALKVSRTAVWKSMKALQSDGYEIRAVTNKGYCLSEDTDILSAPGIGKYLSEQAAEFRIEVLKTIPSTNTALKDKANNGLRGAYAIVSSEQTGGRGRLGRSFHSPSGTGVYFSVLLHPESPAEESTLITAMAAVAVCEAIEKISDAKPQIKWVNDIYVDSKKICGILTEAAFNMESGKLDYVIVGIGVNVYAPDSGFPEGLRDIAGWVLNTPKNDAKNRLTAEIMNCLMAYYRDFEKKRFVEEYRRRSLAVGRRITVLSQDKSIPALGLGIDDNCHLLVRYEDGGEEALSAGEISIRL